jgi:general L-amino acid transport system substrate-binding protein
VRGFAAVDAAGRYSGFDVDICRAVAAAIFGSPDRTRLVPLATIDEFLSGPEIDLVNRRLTWTLRRENVLPVRFGPVTYYDGQTFLVRRGAAARISELGGRPICVEEGSPAQANLTAYFRAQKLPLREVVIEPDADIEGALAQRRCEAYTADQTMLASLRAGFMRPGQFTILPELISKEPLAPVVRRGDERLLAIVRWTVFALIAAEESGVTSRNVDAMLDSDDPDVRRLLGVDPGNGAALGLDERWAYNVIKALGNYGELLERNVGPGTAAGVARGLNRLWSAGGLMWAPPVR